MVMVGEPVTCHLSVAGPPGAIWNGSAVNERILVAGVFGLTVTLTVRVAEPPSLDAVSVYVVLAEGDAVVLVRPVTRPTPLSICSWVASSTDHASVTGSPASDSVGVTVNELMT